MKFDKLSTCFFLPALWVAGCATFTSDYAPKNPARSYLVMKSGQFALARDKRVISSEHSFSALVVCDPEARKSGLAAERRFRSSYDLQVTSSILGVLMIGTPAVPVLQYFAARDRGYGMAGMIDALNQSNDADACTDPAAVLSAR